MTADLWNFVSAFYLLLSIVCASTTSCVYRNDLNASGGYDPDGAGGVGSFPIECEGEYLVVHHLHEDRTLVNDYADHVCVYSHLCMMTSSNGNIFRVTGPLCGEFTGPGEFPTQRPVTRSFDVFFDLRLNKRLNKQP